jgi:hypothetical protein
MYRKIPRSSFMIDPLGEAVTTSDAYPVQSPPIMGPIRPIYVVSSPPPAQMPPTAAPEPLYSVTWKGKRLSPTAEYVVLGVLGWCVYAGMKNALELLQRKVP